MRVGERSASPGSLQALAKFEEQAQETLGKITQTADRRKAEQDAQRRVAKTKRELREDFETTVLATNDDSRQWRIQPLRIEEGARVCWATARSKWKPDS
jgi:hypothetical protein